MRRREFLTALPVTAGLTGCLSRSGEPSGSSSDGGTGAPPTANGTDDPSSGNATESATTTELPSPDVALRSAYRYFVNDDGIGVTAPENAQFAFVRPPDDVTDLSPESFTLELSDREFAPATSVDGFQSSTPGVDAVYTADGRSGRLRFDVPTVQIDDGALVADGTQYPLPESSIDAFGTAPDLSLQSVSAPDSVPPNGEIELTVEAANDGDREGTFLAGFRHGGLPKTVDVTVAPGETETGRAVYDAYGDAGGKMGFSFSYPGGGERFTVAIEEDG